MVGFCDGVLLSLAQHARQNDLWQDSARENDVVRNLTDHRFLRNIASVQSDYRGGAWSGDLMVADYEDLQESEASDICVKRLKKSS